MKNYIAQLNRGDYSDEEILDALITLRDTYIRRQQSSVYSGRSPTETTMIISELGSAISWYSTRVGNTNDRYSCGYYSYACNQYSYNQNYYPVYNYNQNYYPYQYSYNIPTVSNQTFRITNTYLATNTSTSTETRTSITKDNSNNSYESYDVYTFVLQGNGYTNSQPNSSQFLTTSLVRELSTAQGRTVRVSFGTEYRQDSVRNIRTSAQSAYRNSQTTTSISSSYSDSFYSLSSDEFYRQGVSSGYNRTYKTYRLYIAQDNSEAFIVEYQEVGPVGQSNTYSQNILGLDTNSFSYYGSYFMHNYRTSGGSKQYKQYMYIPSRDTNTTTLISNLGINSRMSYNAGYNYNLSVNNERTNTYINGYTVNSGYVSSVESTFTSYVSPSYITLPASSSSFVFYPQTSYNFQNVRLSDGTYRMYRLLVATDGSEAYLTEYIENNPYY